MQPAVQMKQKNCLYDNNPVIKYLLVHKRFFTFWYKLQNISTIFLHFFCPAYPLGNGTRKQGILTSSWNKEVMIINEYLQKNRTQ